MKKIIFNHVIKINFNGSKHSDVLKDELSVYEDSAENESIKINIVDRMPLDKCIRNNPREYYELDDSIIFVIAGTYLRWFKSDDIVRIDVMFKEKKYPAILKVMLKLKDSQFYSQYQKTGMLFHELVLIPLLYQLDDYAMIHSSAFTNGNRTFILGGTGGTGKTSLSMKLCRKPDFSFISDDMLPISSECVFPNYAFPKIYAYNTIGENEVEKEILKNDSLLGKIHWNIFKKISLVGVRRRVNPKEFYNNSHTDISKNRIKYIILSRGNFSEINIQKINHIHDVSQATLEIIKCELGHINKYFNFHKYNSILENQRCIFDLDDMYAKKMQVYNEFFSKTDNYVMNIPLDMPHSEYLDQAEKIIMSL